jgi:hypothetical protein
MTKPLSEWFTLTDEAFLLLCLESYVPKWNREWAQRSRALIAAAAERQQEGEQKEGDGEDALYTGRSRGTKRSWSKDGLERFNGLMVDVERIDLLENKVLRLINDVELRQLMGTNARNTVEKRFSIKATTQQIENCYNKILAI